MKKVIKDLTEILDLLDVYSAISGGRISDMRTALKNCIDELKAKQKEREETIECLRKALILCKGVKV
jgi:hypothetical protein